MTIIPRLIFDTNILISRMLLPDSLPAQAVRKGLQEGQVLVSDHTMMELAEVLSRRKFDNYVSIEDRQEFFQVLGRIVEKVPIIKVVRECRDPKDDKFLELAVNGKADVLLTGDQDLLSFQRFHNTKIITVEEYLSREK